MANLVGLLESIKIPRGRRGDTLTGYMSGARAGFERETLAEL